MRKYFDTLLDIEGRPIPGAEISVTDNNGDPVTIYSEEGGAEIEQPLLTNSLGYYEFFAPDGTYRLLMSYLDAPAVEIPSVQIYDDAADRIITSRAILLPTGEINMVVPPVPERAGKFWIWGGGGEPAVSTGSGGADPTLRTDLADTGGAGMVGVSGGGSLQSAINARPTSDALADSDGASLIGGIVDDAIPNPVILRTIMLDAQVSRMLAGAGDGDTDPSAVTAETAKFQALIDQGRSFSVPEPDVTYTVNTLALAQGQTIEGCGQFGSPLDAAGGKFQFTGNGVDPVFRCGDGTGDPRQMTLRDLSVYNDGAACVDVSNAPNFIAERVRLRALDGANALQMALSYRAAIRDSHITASGGGTAIHALDKMNGLTIDNVTCTGGSAGRAMQIGQSQGIRLVSNIIESSREGIFIGATSDSGDGNCNGVLVAANYFEQVGEPLRLGTRFTLSGLECVSNFLSNGAASVITYRQAMIQFGRIRGGLIADNVLIPVDASSYPGADPEDLYWIWLESDTGGYENLSVVRNNVQGTPTNVFQFKGTYASSASVKSTVGGTCNFGFMGSGDPLGSDGPSEWISPVIDSSATTPASGLLTWLPDSRIQMGGLIKSAEIIDYDGGTLTDVTLQIGRSANAGENVSLADMSALSFTNGRAALAPTATVLDGSDRTYRIVTAVGATGKFRIRIRYRAN